MKDTQVESINEQRTFEFFNSLLGYKILLRNYECPLGKADLIGKHNKELVFIAANTDTATLALVAKYYIKRYGINDVPYRLIVL